MRTLRVMLLGVLFPTLSFALESGQATTISDLPLAAQGKISAVLGRDSTQFSARPVNDGFEAAGGGLNTRFAAGGIEVRNGDTRWGLHLRRYGYESNMRTAREVAPNVMENRVEYRRAALTEWYINGPMGLEQGFTIHHRPGRAGGPLIVVLETSGNLTAKVIDSSTSLALVRSDGGEELRYSGLAAYDADGKKLESGVRIQGNALSLYVEDGGARYPITVDPIVQLARLTSTDGLAGGGLGLSVAVSGDVVVAGTYTGVAYVFEKPPNGWHDMTQSARLIASDGGGEAFVAISGDAIVLGEPDASVNGNTHQGAAYVFLKPRNGWKDMYKETAKLVASDGVAGDDFGKVAISGDTVVVGAFFATVDGNPNEGAAYVFEKAVGDWANSEPVILTETAKLTPSDGGGFFGAAVAMSGDNIAIGAYGANEAYVFVKPPTGWVSTTETATLKPSDGGGLVGQSVATNGSVVVAGADKGAFGDVYVFVKQGNSWTNMNEAAQLEPPQGALGFSQSVAISPEGHVIAVGAPYGRGSGEVFIYVEPPTGWQTTQQFKYRVFPANGENNEGFGVSVSLQGNSVIAGAPGADFGTAFVFARQ